MGKICAKRNKRIFASAATSWLFVTRMLTQFCRCAISVKHLSAIVSQLSVNISISAKTCTHLFRSS